MIRYIPLSKEDTGYRFAFWNTVTDRFLSFNDDWAWNGTKDLDDSLYLAGADDELSDRLLAFVPAELDDLSLGDI